MATNTTDIQKMIQELNQYILPSTLMQCFDAYREEQYKEAIKEVPESTLAWFLDLLNRDRGPEDKKESLLDRKHVHREPPGLGKPSRHWMEAPVRRIQFPDMVARRWRRSTSRHPSLM